MPIKLDRSNIDNEALSSRHVLCRLFGRPAPDSAVGLPGALVRILRAAMAKKRMFTLKQMLALRTNTGFDPPIATAPNGDATRGDVKEASLVSGLAAYREKHGLPFFFKSQNVDADKILSLFARRTAADTKTAHEEACSALEYKARLKLEELPS